MKNYLKQLAAAMLMLVAVHPAQADVLLLVHGWAANANTWAQSGVLPTLQQADWRYAGVLTTTHNQVMLVAPVQTTSSNKVYLAHLVAEAPLMLQAGQLLAELDYVAQHHPGEKIILAGHSAGGVVARLALIHQNAPAVNTLITIATPNLGTPRALDGLEVVDSKPFFCPGPGIDFMKTVLGGNNYDYLKVSRAALIDLAPASTGSLTAWLNHQSHPAIEYHAIIHLAQQQGDGIVPAFSQDLNQVAALSGKAQQHVLVSGHGLTPADGQVLVSILSGR